MKFYSAEILSLISSAGTLHWNVTFLSLYPYCRVLYLVLKHHCVKWSFSISCLLLTRVPYDACTSRISTICRIVTHMPNTCFQSLRQPYHSHFKVTNHQLESHVFFSVLHHKHRCLLVLLPFGVVIQTMAWRKDTKQDQHLFTLVGVKFFVHRKVGVLFGVVATMVDIGVIFFNAVLECWAPCIRTSHAIRILSWWSEHTRSGWSFSCLWRIKVSSYDGLRGNIWGMFCALSCDGHLGGCVSV